MSIEVLKKEDPVMITLEGKQIEASVILVTKFGTAGAVVFNGFIGGYFGIMPLMYENEKYTDLVQGREVIVKKI